MRKKRWIPNRYRSKLSPVFSDQPYEEDEMSLDDYRRMCDLCHERRKPDKPKRYDRAFTCVNADKIVALRDLSELALKLFNDDKSNSFKLLKVCKINRRCRGYYGLTFRAQEDGIKESLVFRGVVRALREKNEALFCEIKDDDDEITLLSCDDDYVSSERACESEDCPPCKRWSEDLINLVFPNLVSRTELVVDSAAGSAFQKMIFETADSGESSRNCHLSEK